MFGKSITLVLPLSKADCLEHIKRLGKETGLKENIITDEKITWSARNYSLEISIKAISDNKTEVGIIARSNALFDILGTLDQQTKIFAIRLKKKVGVSQANPLTSILKASRAKLSVNAENNLYLFLILLIFVFVSTIVNIWQNGFAPYPAWWEIIGSAFGGIVVSLMKISSWQISPNYKWSLIILTFLTASPFFLLLIIPGPGSTSFVNFLVIPFILEKIIPNLGIALITYLIIYAVLKK